MLASEPALPAWPPDLCQLVPLRKRCSMGGGWEPSSQRVTGALGDLSHRPAKALLPPGFAPGRQGGREDPVLWAGEQRG